LPDWQLVEGPHSLLRLLPLPSRLPRGERYESQARRLVRGRTRAIAANRGIHALVKGVCRPGVEGAPGYGPGRLEAAEQARKKLQQKLHRLDDAFLFERSIDIDTYDRHADRVREQMTLLKIDEHTSKLEELDVEGILAFAERVLPRTADLWVQASLDQRQRLQQLFFPQGVAFDGNGLLEPP
jgi:hypothetical protein